MRTYNTLGLMLKDFRALLSAEDVLVAQFGVDAYARLSQ
jgi:hypothetical protein